MLGKPPAQEMYAKFKCIVYFNKRFIWMKFDVKEKENPKLAQNIQIRWKFLVTLRKIDDEMFAIDFGIKLIKKKAV